jgi:hypothetical protein
MTVTTHTMMFWTHWKFDRLYQIGVGKYSLRCLLIDHKKIKMCPTFDNKYLQLHHHQQSSMKSLLTL